MTLPILIIGAGITGLTLAQSLRKQGIPFRIFDRDASLTSRPGGWGLTISWADSLLGTLLPPDIVQKLEESHVTREALETGDYGRFTLFDLSTGVAKYNVPAAKRMRFGRARLREILALGVDVEWSKRLKAVDTLDDRAIALFDDGTSVQGCLVVGCDGAHSRLRQILYPASYQNRPVPVRMLGVTTRYSGERVAGARAIDRYFFQGTHGTSGVYLFFSFLETPHSSPMQRDYLCQIVLSWPEAKGLAIPASNEDRVALMKKLATDWAEPFRSLVQSIPPDTPVTSINVEDWLPSKTHKHGHGRMLLMGDAAHTMTMFRGEGANQAIADVHFFMVRVAPLLTRSSSSSSSSSSEVSSNALHARLNDYEDEMLNRVRPVVADSRRACWHAHQLDLIDEESPLVARRLQQARARA